MPGRLNHLRLRLCVDGIENRQQAPCGALLLGELTRRGSLFALFVTLCVEDKRFFSVCQEGHPISLEISGQNLLVPVQGNVYGKNAPFAGGAFHRQPASMYLYDMLRNGEAQTCPA